MASSGWHGRSSRSSGSSRSARHKARHKTGVAKQTVAKQTPKITAAKASCPATSYPAQFGNCGGRRAELAAPAQMTVECVLFFQAKKSNRNQATGLLFASWLAWKLLWLLLSQEEPGSQQKKCHHCDASDQITDGKRGGRFALTLRLTQDVPAKK